MSGFSRLRIGLLLALFLTLGRPASATPFWTFSLIPSNGQIAGPAGASLGWGYAITNPDPVNWLLLSALAPGIFQHGTPDASLFNFPTVAPASTITVPFLAGIQGLFGFTWDLSVPAAFVNSGTFVVSADWYTGDPSGGGAFLELAPDQSAAYAVTAGTAQTPVVPEPSTFALLGMGLFAVIRTARHRRGVSRP